MTKQEKRSVYVYFAPYSEDQMIVIWYVSGLSSSYSNDVSQCFKLQLLLLINKWVHHLELETTLK